MVESKIGQATLLFLVNAAGVKQIKARAPEMTDIQLATALMAGEGSRNELIKVDAGTYQLSTSSQARCEKTPVYKEKRGGIYILSERIDEDTRKQEELLYLGTIDPEGYAATLRAKFGIRNKKIYVSKKWWQFWR